MKAMKKLIPAVAMLLVSVVTMSTASFAWFSLSRQVTAQGMNVTVTAPTNLLITVKGEDSYNAVATNQATNIFLIPASTTTGKTNNFFVIADNQIVGSDGELVTSAENQSITTTLAKGEPAVSGGSYQPGAYYDFKYTIKNDGDADSNVDVVVRSIEVTAASSNGSQSLKPVRVAVMLSDESKVLLYSKNGGTNKVDGQAVASIAEGTGIPTRGAVTYVSGDNADLVTLSGNTPTDIIIRVWYEGEDTECTASKGAKANFDVKVVLADKTYNP